MDEFIVCFSEISDPRQENVPLRANDDETFTPREFRLDGAEGSSQSCPCSRDRLMRRPVTARTEAHGLEQATRCRCVGRAGQQPVEPAQFPSTTVSKVEMAVTAAGRDSAAFRQLRPPR